MRSLRRFILGARAVAVACAPLGLPACSRSLPAQPAIDAAPEDTEIGFDQRGCYGPCAVYSVTFRGDGTLEYEGRAYVAAKGHRSARVSPSGVADLARHFDDVHFENMTWHKNCPEKYTTDHGTVKLTFRRGARSHTIEHDLGDGCAPADLHRLEEHLSTVIEPAIHDLVNCDAGSCPP